MVHLKKVGVAREESVCGCGGFDYRGKTYYYLAVGSDRYLEQDEFEGYGVRRSTGALCAPVRKEVELTQEAEGVLRFGWVGM